MAEADFKELRLAVLIDADNVPSSRIVEMMEEVSKYGTPTFKRIYGDWTSTSLSGWKRALNDNALVPIQQFAYTTGKNATDSALIIDAMDILYTRRVDGFFLVSSDSDFTRLATRLREEGMRVFGMGEKKTPRPFIKACEKFIYIEILGAAAASATPASSQRPAAEGRGDDRGGDGRSGDDRGRKDKTAALQDRDLRELVYSTIEDLTDEDDGWLPMGALANGLMRKRPDFDARNYGFRKLTDLVSALDFVDVTMQQANGNKHPCIRLRS